MMFTVMEMVSLLPGDVLVGDDERFRDGVGVLCCWWC